MCCIGGVYTGDRWLRIILLEDSLRVICSENGAKDTPRIESLGDE